MGFPGAEATWDAVKGAAYYPGAGSGMEGMWLIASAVLCVVALIVGARHENAAYRRKQAE
ncbi:MAG: hypothetical protein AAFZ01_04935 [Pseudomonadota bacterium]